MDGPALVLVFDDGFAADYEQIRPVLDEAGVPACLAIVPDWLGEEGHLDANRLAELADDGWEVAAHGRKHRFLQARRLRADVAPGETEIPVDDHVFPGEAHAVVAGDEMELVGESEGDQRNASDRASGSDRGERHASREEVRVADTVDDGSGDPVVVVEELIDGRYAADESVLRPAEALLRDEIVGVREEFRELGYDPTTFVFPYDAADPRAWEIAAEHYDALPNAGVRSLPNPPGTPGTNLRRYYLQTTHATMPEIETYLDAVAGLAGVGILAGHSAWDSVPPERVAAVVEEARERGISVTTFGD
ncbi:polysaccharide deacetylase family protein [Halomicrobium urmianum]|uniref:polysaccharide deacetylase family protein n=1 Tax=Halomicrobium urmianum TaxID=1586233 RepID=UPI001CDA179F|nr:polysaccharide deacetylase family protein [Halomicrobium urmianum]